MSLDIKRGHRAALVKEDAEKPTSITNRHIINTTMKTINHHTTLMIGLLLFITTSSASSAVVDKNNRKSFEEVAVSNMYRYILTY
jgi:hypothetical protein